MDCHSSSVAKRQRIGAVEEVVDLSTQMIATQLEPDSEDNEASPSDSNGSRQLIDTRERCDNIIAARNRSPAIADDDRIKSSSDEGITDVGHVHGPPHGVDGGTDDFTHSPSNFTSDDVPTSTLPADSIKTKAIFRESWTLPLRAYATPLISVAKDITQPCVVEAISSDDDDEANLCDIAAPSQERAGDRTNAEEIFQKTILEETGEDDCTCESEAAESSEYQNGGEPQCHTLECSQAGGVISDATTISSDDDHDGNDFDSAQNVKADGADGGYEESPVHGTPDEIVGLGQRGTSSVDSNGTHDGNDFDSTAYVKGGGADDGCEQSHGGASSVDPIQDGGNTTCDTVYGDANESDRDQQYHGWLCEVLHTGGIQL